MTTKIKVKRVMRAKKMRQLCYGLMLILKHNYSEFGMGLLVAHLSVMGYNTKEIDIILANEGIR